MADQPQLILKTMLAIFGMVIIMMTERSQFTGSQGVWGNAKADSSSQNNDALIIPSAIGGKTVSTIADFEGSGLFSMFSPEVIKKIVLPKTMTSEEIFSNATDGVCYGLFGKFVNLKELDLGGVKVEQVQFLDGEKITIM